MLHLQPINDKVIQLDWQIEASNRILDVLFFNGEVIKPKSTNLLAEHSLNGQPPPEIKIVARGSLLRAGTGTGKMYMTAQAVRSILEQNLLYKPDGIINPFPILWLCPKSVKSQTQRVIAQYGLTGQVMILSYSELKTTMGQMYIEWLTSPDGNIVCMWKPNMLPLLVVCDECQVLKNPESLQSRCIRALPDSTKSIFASATPFQRVVDSRTLIERVGARTKYNQIPASKQNSAQIVSDIAWPKSINEYSPSAVERLRNELTNYIVELKNVRFKHKAKTECVDIYFKNEQERKAYDKIYQRLLDNLRKLRSARGNSESFIAILVELQKMQQAAELLRANQIAERIVANLDTKAVIVASNFRETLNVVKQFLIKKHKISEERISIVIGGQKSDVRQQMVDEFQSGKRDIILFTMRSGGVGISLHHDRVTTKPRHVILPPTWSAIDLVQALGRAHRLTSLSVTTQEILWYAETVEADVKVVVQNKVKCLSKAVTAKEQFIHTFEKSIDEDEELTEEIEKQHHSTQDDSSDDVDNDDDSLTGEGLEND